MNCRLFTFKRYPWSRWPSIKSPSPTGRALQGRSSHKDNVSLHGLNPREKCIAEIFQNMPHAFSFWILSLPRRKEISNFLGSEIVSDLHSGSPPLVEMRSSADAATTAKLHHRSPCKGEKTKKWIRNIGNHVGLRIPYFSTKARHSKQNIFINLKKNINLEQSVVTNSRNTRRPTLPASPTSVSTNIRGPDSGILTTPSWTGTSDLVASFQGAFVLVLKKINAGVLQRRWRK